MHGCQRSRSNVILVEAIANRVYIRLVKGTVVFPKTFQVGKGTDLAFLRGLFLLDHLAQLANVFFQTANLLNNGLIHGNHPCADLALRRSVNSLWEILLTEPFVKPSEELKAALALMHNCVRVRFSSIPQSEIRNPLSPRLRRTSPKSVHTPHFNSPPVEALVAMAAYFER
jgi:hypothetical protein